MTGTGHPSLPWQDSDVLMVAVTAVLGLMAIVGAWFGASGSLVLRHQMVWLNIAIAGFAVTSGGLALWLLRSRRRVGERRIGLVSWEPAVAEELDDPPAPAGHTAALELVRGTGMSRVHLAECPLLDGKQALPATLADGEPCGVCSR